MRKIRLTTIIVLFLYGVFQFIAMATTIRVPADQPNIQSGINAANNGDTVLVSPGTYAGNINFNGKKIVVASLFLLTGDTSSISQTTINGNTNASAVTFMKGEDSTTILTGFTITGGAGGIYCQNSSPVLRNLTITKNTIIQNGGGGVCCYNASPALTNVVITNNTSQVWEGGGLYCSNSSPVVTNATISGNTSGEDGGGVYFYASSKPIIQNSIIVNNFASWFGGGVACYDSSPLFSGVTVSQNEGMSWYGGGFYFNNSKPVLKNNLITNNKVDESVGIGSGGGGICCDNHSLVSLSGTTIARNSAFVAGGGIVLQDDSSTVMFDGANRCNIYLNEAEVGNDIYSYWGKTHVIVDTFTVLYPTNDQLFPIGNFSVDILHGKIAQNQSVLYVSPSGSNENSGTSPDAPLQTIGFAKSIIQGTPQKQATIYLAPGTYSRETNGEHFELDLTSYITLKGSGVNQTIIQGDAQDGVLFYSSTTRDTVEDLTIKNGGYGLGGGVYCSTSDVFMKNVIITGCTSIEGGAINISFNANLTVENALIYGNTASLWGGAFSGYHASCNFINVTMVNNTTSGQGAGIYCQSSNINLINSILWNNSPGEVYFYEKDSPSSIQVIHSDVDSGRVGIKENGNGSVMWDSSADFFLDPSFVNPSQGDFHLTAKSPCIGAGVDSVNVNGTWFWSPREDIEYVPRIDSVYRRPDLGAFEYKTTSYAVYPDQGNSMPVRYELYQNYPNPFNSSTTFSFALPSSSPVSLKIFDILGREVETIIAASLPAGYHSRQWNAGGHPSGVYFYRLQAGSFVETKKFVLLK